MIDAGLSHWCLRTLFWGDMLLHRTTTVITVVGLFIIPRAHVLHLNGLNCSVILACHWSVAIRIIEDKHAMTTRRTGCCL
jgi:hypothetical protein